MPSKKQSKKLSSFLNNKFDYVLLVDILLLLSLGLVMVLSASAPSSLVENNNSYYYFVRQGIFALIGIVLMLIISKIDYRIYKKYYWLFYVISLVFLFLVLVPGIGKTANGATRWVKIPGLGQFQPSEFTKMGLILFYAGYLSNNKKEINTLKKGFFVPMILLIWPLLLLYFIQNHLSAAVVIGVVVSVMMLMAGTKIIFFIEAGAILVGAIAIAMLKKSPGTSGEESFRIDRIKTFLDPWSDASGTGYQMIQSLYAIGSGGLFGVGLGQSKQKFLYIPEPQNDFIFSILAEELGFVGCTIVILLFALFIWRGIIISMKADDMFGSLIAVGITTLVGIQVIINIAVVTASLPTTGMPLPFFSYGGTALVLLLMACGILLNISRSTSKI